MQIIFQCNNNTTFPFVLKYGSIPPNSMFFPSRLGLKSSPSGTINFKKTVGQKNKNPGVNCGDMTCEKVPLA